MRARVKKTTCGVLCHAPLCPTYTYLFYVDICAASYFVFSIEDLQVDFFPNVYYREGTFRGETCVIVRAQMNLIYPIYPQTNYYPLQQVEGQAHRLWNVLNKGTLSSHHYHVVCLASVPYFVCNVFFRRKRCTSRQAFYYKLAKQLSQF